MTTKMTTELWKNILNSIDNFLYGDLIKADGSAAFSSVNSWYNVARELCSWFIVYLFFFVLFWLDEQDWVLVLKCIFMYRDSHYKDEMVLRLS